MVFRPEQNINPEQALLESLHLVLGTRIKLHKLVSEKESGVTVGTVLEGVLDKDIKLGESIHLDNSQRNTTEVLRVYKQQGKILIKTRTSVYELIREQESVPSAPERLEFGDFGVMQGNLERDGYVAFNSNHSSNQDAFAVNHETGVFVVADGLGSHAKSGAVSRFISARIAEEITHLADLQPGWFKKKVEELLRDQEYIDKYTLTDSRKEKDGRTTVTVIKRLSENEFQLFILGDSPAYIIDEEGGIVRSFGTESAGDSGVPGSVGFSPEGKPTMGGNPKAYLIKKEPGQKIIIGSDYLSDGLFTEGDALRKWIREAEKNKQEGGFYSLDGRYVAPSDLPESQRKKYEFIPWNSKVEERLTKMKGSLQFYDAVMKDPDTYSKKYGKDPKFTREQQRWQKEAKRNLKEFLTIRTGEEFYQRTTGENAWKKDDATVIIIK